MKGYKLRMTYLGICIGIDIIFMVIMVGAGISLVSEKDIFDGVGCIIVGVMALLWLLIDCGGIFRLRDGKSMVILTGFLMKFWAFIMMLAGAIFLSEDVGIGVGIAVIDIAVLLILTLVHRHKKKTVSTNQNAVANDTSGYPKNFYFDKDKSEWLYDDVAAEYCRLNNKNIEEFTEEDNDKIYEYAGNHIGYFITWLIKNDFVSSEFVELYGQAIVDDIKNERISPNELMQNMDYVLSKDDISENGIGFVDRYYNNPWTQGHISFYEHDLYIAMENVSKINYCVDFSWDTYRLLEEKINRSFSQYLIDSDVDNEIDYDEIAAKLELEKIESDKIDSDGRIYSEAFAQKLDVYVAKNVPKEYIEKCIEHAINMPEKTVKAVCKGILKCCWGMEDGEYPDVNKLDSCYEFLRAKLGGGDITILKPNGDEVGYILGFESPYEEEHGHGITIRGDYVVEACYRMDASSPWSEECSQTYYSLLDIDNGRIIEVDTIPESLRKYAKCESEKILLPESVVKRKADEEIVMARILRKINGGEYKMSIVKDEEKEKPFPESIYLWVMVGTEKARPVYSKRLNIYI